MPIEVWGNYLAAMAEVTATLSGLVFVAVSINLNRVLSVPGLPGRAAESLLQLLGVAVIATTALVPHQPPLWLGVEILLTALALWMGQTAAQIRYMAVRAGHPLRWAVQRIVQTQLATVPMFVAAVLLMRGSPSGLYWLAPGFVVSLVAGTLNAWVLLIEIVR